MAEEHKNAMGNGGLEFDEVLIDGAEYRIRKEVVDEIINLRRGTAHEIIERIKTLHPVEGDTIVVCTPAKVSHEFVSQVGQVTKGQFPEHQVAVLPEGLQLHTVMGLAELCDCGMQLAVAVQENNPEAAKPLADKFVGLLNETNEEEPTDGD